jgi:hypothetical protein
MGDVKFAAMVLAHEVKELRAIARKHCQWNQPALATLYKKDARDLQRAARILLGLDR